MYKNIEYNIENNVYHKDSEELKLLNSKEALENTSYYFNRAIYLYLKLGDRIDAKMKFKNLYKSPYILKTEMDNKRRLSYIFNLIILEVQKQNQNINISHLFDLKNTFWILIKYVINSCEKLNINNMFIFNDSGNNDSYIMKRALLGATLSMCCHFYLDYIAFPRELENIKPKYFKFHNHYLYQLELSDQEIKLFQALANSCIDDIFAKIIKK